MKSFVVVLLSFLFCGIEAARSQSFSVNPTQVEVVLAAGYNHQPVRVSILSNAPAFDIKALKLNSDSAWVNAELDSEASKVVLKFSTAALIAKPSTATITAIQGATTNRFFVYASLSPLNVTKLIADPVRPRVYGLHQNGVNAGALISYDPLNGKELVCQTLGNRPTDLAISKDGSELLVIHSVEKSIRVLDPASLELKETILLNEFDDWGAGSTSADLALGPNGTLYYTDGSWAPVLRVFDRSRRTVLQRVGIDSFGFGAFALTANQKHLVGWAQYGWSAGFAGSYLARFAVDATGMLTFVEETSPSYPGPLGRDPLDSPVLMSNDDTKCFVKQLMVRPQSVTSTLGSYPGPVYAITPGGEVAMTSSAVFQTSTGIKLLDLPVSAPVQVVTTDYSRLVYFDPLKQSVTSLNLLAAIGPAVMNRKVSPADGEFILPPERLSWPPIPGSLRYELYLGTSSDEVAAAGTNSPTYLGAVNTLDMLLTNSWSAGATYFWRVDAINASDTVKGDVYRFTVSEISVSSNQINLSTLQGHSRQTATLQLESSVAGKAWEAVSPAPWVSFEPQSGTTPASLTIRVDASKLPPGVTNTTVSLRNGDRTILTAPLTLRVDPLNLTVIKSDPTSRFAYGISEDTASASPRAYLLEINTDTEAIERVVAVGSSATDLAVHIPDGRVYVTNWRPGILQAVNLSRFEIERAYAVAPFGGIGGSSGDVFKVSAGTAGRLVVEEMDQWIDISIFNTASGKNVASNFQREGGGAFSPDRRYYYHGDNNSSGAEIHKLDVLGDVFKEVAHARTTGAGFGSRTLVVSEDGGRIFWGGSALKPSLEEEWIISDVVYSCTKDGRYAFGQDRIYDVLLRRAVLGMPASTTVSAFNTTTRKLVVSVAGSLRFFVVGEVPSLPKPVLSSAGATVNSITVAWTDDSLETSFTMQMRLAGSTAWQDLATLPQNTARYTATGLLSGSIYEFRVKADASQLSSDWSGVLTATTPLPAPAAPALSDPAVVTDRVVLRWTDPVGADGFVLERRTSKSDPFLPLSTLASHVLTFTDRAVVPGAQYEYRVKAVGVGGASDYSSSRTVLVPFPSPPPAPILLSLQARSESVVEVAWGASEDAAGYVLQRRTDNPQSWVQLAVLSSDINLYRDTSVISGTEYWYRVAATNSIGRSEFSSVMSIIPNVSFCAIGDDFDAGVDARVWAEIRGGVAVDGGRGFLGSKALWFGTNTVRSATTMPLPLQGEARMEFQLKAGSQDTEVSPFWDNSESGESIVLEYSVDGFTWKLLQSFDTSGTQFSNWSRLSIPIPSTANSPRTQFRWRQLKHSGAGFDTWALEDVCIRVDAPPSIPAPSFVVASLQPANSVEVLWLSTPGAFYYSLERKVEGQPWVPLVLTPSEQSFYTDTTVLPKTTYSYRVKAVNSLIESTYSPIATVTTATQLASWSAMNFGRTDVPLEDVDAGGVSNLVRYAYNLGIADPLTVVQPGDATGLPRIWYDSGLGRLRVELVRRRPAAEPGVVYAVQFSNDLKSWEDARTPLASVPVDALWERLTFEDAAGAASAQGRYCRVVIQQVR